MRRFGSWLMGWIVVVILAGACAPAEAQVVFRVGDRHRHHRHYRHHHRPYRR